jgi:capsular polysaccharide export protein
VEFPTHRPYRQVIEYAGWLCRLALKRSAERAAVMAIEDLAGVSGPLFFLQLAATTIRWCTRASERCPRRSSTCSLRSPAMPDAARLVVKLDPLDSGIVDWPVMTGHIGAELRIADRLIVVDEGDLDKILARCRAVGDGQQHRRESGVGSRLAGNRNWQGDLRYPPD